MTALLIHFLLVLLTVFPFFLEFFLRVESAYPGPVEATVWVDGKVACNI